MIVRPHHAVALRALECQVARRVSPLSQAWAWAVIIETLTAPPVRTTTARTGHHARTRTRTRARTRRTLAWLHHQMQWAREDLEEAGAWPIGLAIEVDLTSDGIVEFCLPLLRRLADVPDCEPDGRAAILEAQARARACLRALAGEGHGLPAALAAA